MHKCRARPGRCGPRASRVVSADERPELLGHSVDQFLLVSLIFPKLCKHVVLAAGVLHPEQREKEREPSVWKGKDGMVHLSCPPGPRVQNPPIVLPAPTALSHSVTGNSREPAMEGPTPLLPIPTLPTSLPSPGMHLLQVSGTCYGDDGQRALTECLGSTYHLLSLLNPAGTLELVIEK